jgi:hypothetical protein
MNTSDRVKAKVYYQVPFVENPDDRCVPATMGMILGHFMPEKHFTMADLERLCGYQKGRGTWIALFLLNLADMGFQVHCIEDFDHQQFVNDPRKYLRAILDDDAYEWQVSHSDLDAEAARIQQYMARGLPLEKRQGTKEDIKRFLDDGWLVKLAINARTLSGKPGYDGHSILAVGYTDTEVIIHNPDGDSGNMPNQHVSWELFRKAWEEFGGSCSLYAVKR